ncbi:mercury resistance system periplasmic binding protein MerP [Pararhodobacter sp.]|uniref:mercury resistance system periplasmic binding protein MerP n=1 Tax=Pararhodobacter sp. TaxID=2127056 RepID=UPI002AFE8DA2|nr:mercury resistance system periplasmic binding protein MerP [Pararhodobacter sp.]
MKKMLVAAALSILTAPAWAVPTTVTLSIPTMDCPVCPITVKKALTKVPGVSQATISYEKRLATVTYESTKASVDALVQATTNAGYPSILMEHAK